MKEKGRLRELGADQAMARDPTPQPNNIRNIHQIGIYYLKGFHLFCKCAFEKACLLTLGLAEDVLGPIYLSLILLFYCGCISLGKHSKRLDII